MTTPTESFAAFKTFAKFALAVCLLTIRPGFADQQANPDHVLLQLDIQGSKAAQSHFFQIQSAENGSRQFIDVMIKHRWKWRAVIAAELNHQLR